MWTLLSTPCGCHHQANFNRWTNNCIEKFHNSIKPTSCYYSFTWLLADKICMCMHSIQTVPTSNGQKKLQIFFPSSFVVLWSDRCNVKDEDFIWAHDLRWYSSSSHRRLAGYRIFCLSTSGWELQTEVLISNWLYSSI